MNKKMVASMFLPLVCVLIVWALPSYVQCATSNDSSVSAPRIMQNVENSKFGDVLRSLALLHPLSYSIASTPLSAAQSQSAGGGAHPGQAQSVNSIYDIRVSFSYSGDSMDEAVSLLCKAADVYCEKEDNRWLISRYETYIADRSIFWTYSLGTGGGSSSSGSSTATPSPASSGTSSSSSTVGGVTSNVGQGGGGSLGSIGTDTIGISGNYDDLSGFIKPFLSKDGVIQIGKGGYLVVMDSPSYISRVRKIIAKETAMDAKKVKVNVSIVSVTKNDDFSAGVNWNAVIKNVAINGTFAPSSAMTFAYNTVHDGRPVDALVGVLGSYGNAKVEKSWEYPVISGVPVFFNVVENVPYFITTTTALNTNASQTSTTPSYVTVGLMCKILPSLRDNELDGGLYAQLSQLLSIQTSGNSTAPDTSLTNTAVPLSIPFGYTEVVTGFKTSTKSFADSGVPFFSRIPFIGSLFGSQAKNNDNTELAIVITVTKE